MPEQPPIHVTATDPATGESDTQEIWDDYCIVAVEWNRLDADGKPTANEGGWRGYNAENYVREMQAKWGGTAVWRTRTSFPDVVGEWTPVEPEVQP